MTVSQRAPVTRRHVARAAICAMALLVPLSLSACGDEEKRRVRELKTQVQTAFGDKNFRKSLDLAQKGLVLAQKTMGDDARETLIFAAAITKSQLALGNKMGAIRAVKQEIALKVNAGQDEVKQIQKSRTLLIQLATETGDIATAIEQTVAVARGIEMGEGKDPQPTFRTVTNYPPEQYRQQVEGDVEIGYGLDANGTPTNVRVVKATPPDVFNAAALESFKEWRFTPFIESGRPVSSSGHRFTLAFRLGRK